MNSEHNTNAAVKFIQGGILAAGNAYISAPGGYLSNMVISHTRPRLKNCLKGVSLTAFNDIPAAAVSFAIQSIAIKHLKINEENTSHQFAAAIAAGSCSGFIITPGEMIVLKYQQNKCNRTLWEIAREVHQTYGMRRLFTGGSAMILREAGYVSGYFFLGDVVAESIQPLVHHEELRVGLAAFLSGMIVGAGTTPAKLLATKKQDQVFNKKVTSYKEEVKKLRWRIVLKNTAIRSPTIGLATLILTEGRRHIFPD